jgi:hypothetical protein
VFMAWHESSSSGSSESASVRHTALLLFVSTTSTTVFIAVATGECCRSCVLWEKPLAHNYTSIRPAVRPPQGVSVAN